MDDPTPPDDHLGDDAEEPRSLADLLAWLHRSLSTLDALAPLLPHLLRVLALWPRLVAVAREAVEEAADERDVQDRLEPLTGEVLDHAAQIGQTLIDNDDLLIRAVEQLAEVIQDAARRPQLARSLEDAKERALDASDTVLAQMVDHALADRHNKRVFDTVRVFEMLVDGMVQRTLDLAMDQREATGRPPDDSAP